MHLIDDETMGFDDGDALVLVARDECCGDELVIVSEPRVVAAGRVSWQDTDVRLPRGCPFGWAAVGDDLVILAASFRDGFVVEDRTEYLVLTAGPA